MKRRQSERASVRSRQKSRREHSEHRLGSLGTVCIQMTAFLYKPKPGVSAGGLQGINGSQVHNQPYNHAMKPSIRKYNQDYIKQELICKADKQFV